MTILLLGLNLLSLRVWQCHVYTDDDPSLGGCEMHPVKLVYALFGAHANLFEHGTITNTGNRSK